MSGDETMLSAQRHMIMTLVYRYNERFQYTQMKLKGLSLLGFIGFPAFYVVWSYVFEQPYENIVLRAIGCVLCGILYFNEKKQGILGKYLGIYSYVVMLYCLPFFFTFMMLMNNVNTAWLGSAICAVLYLTLLLDAVLLIITFTLGTVMAIIFYILLSDTGALPPEYYEMLPIFGFALLGGLGLNYSEELINHQNRMRAVAAIGSSIAHEMRTPLLGIKFDAQGANRHLPMLLNAYDWAIRHGWSAPPLSPTQRQRLSQAFDRIDQQTNFANTMINILLMNIRDHKISSESFEMHSMADIVDRALDRYPFKGTERQLVRWQRDSDFRFFGSDLLMMHVLFNLLKNALRAVAEADGGFIEIRLETTPETNHLSFRDTGTGIPPAMLPHIFEPFHSGARDNSRPGIGLAFCQRIIESFDGTIACRSESGSFTEFVISLSD